MDQDEVFLVLKTAQHVVARLRVSKGDCCVRLQELSEALGCTSPPLQTAVSVSSTLVASNYTCGVALSLTSSVGCDDQVAPRLEASGMLRAFSVGNQEFVKLHGEGTLLEVDANDRMKASHLSLFPPSFSLFPPIIKQPSQHLDFACVTFLSPTLPAQVAKQTLEERCEELRSQIEVDTSLAKSHLKKGAKNQVPLTARPSPPLLRTKPRGTLYQAKMALREKKGREKELEKREAQLLNLLRLGSSLDSAHLDT